MLDFLGNPAIRLWRIRGFPSLPYDGFGFIKAYSFKEFLES
jgi:hypothetical protein